MIYLECKSCGCAGEAELPDRTGEPGLLACPQCGMSPSRIGVTAFADWIDGQVRRKRSLQLAGAIGTRKQASVSDEQIDRDGLAAELAACLVLCPRQVHRWQELAERSGGNRGRDLPASLTGFDKPIEVKQTRYCSPDHGYLLIRPPRMTPGRMKLAYIDDSYYVLLYGKPFSYDVMGWTNRDGLLTLGRANPVPVRAGQRETWGIHWSNLRPISELAQNFIEPFVPAPPPDVPGDGTAATAT